MYLKKAETLLVTNQVAKSILSSFLAVHFKAECRPICVLERPQEFCQWELFNVSCRTNEFILITSARYGRMKVGRCVPVDYFVGCSVDVQDQMETLCSGRKHCTVTISNRDLFRVQPCRKDLVAYLEAGYRCVPGRY